MPSDHGEYICRLHDFDRHRLAEASTPVMVYGKLNRSGLDFIIRDLPSVLILIIADQILNDSLCCSYKYN